MTTSAWSLVYEGFSPAEEGLREALCTLGNGYLATRGAAPEMDADDVHYPGTYLAGCYNTLDDEVGDRTVENESLVNQPNWLPLRFRVEDGPWFDPSTAKLLAYRQELDLRHGLLLRDVRFEDESGRVTRVEQRRLVHMGDPHVTALETTFEAENWSGRLHVVSEVDGSVRNDGVARYRALDAQHLHAVSTTVLDDDSVLLEAETTRSRVRVAVAARTTVWSGDEKVALVMAPSPPVDRAGHRFDLHLERAAPLVVEKVAAVFSSRDNAISDPATNAVRRLAMAGRFRTLQATHEIRWAHLWRRCDIDVQSEPAAGDGEIDRRLKVHLFHLLQTVTKHSADLDVGVPARGLHGEAYRGHVFWDELFIFPYLNLRLPKLTRGLLLYRHRRLPEARAAARTSGYAGAMFPWQSASDGRETTQTAHLNPLSQRWMPDASHLQRHVNAAIAYNTWQYYEATGDAEFLSFYGAELIIEIAAFFASAAVYDEGDERFHLRGVVGPDEYHEAYPGAENPGIDDNAYTNVMAAWVLMTAVRVAEVLGPDRGGEILEALGVTTDDLARWDAVSRRLHVPFLADDVIAQFEGFGDLDELDWEGYRQRFGDISRLDRILEAEGDSPNRYQLTKQADVVMLLYLLDADALEDMLGRLGYDPVPGFIDRTLAYYLPRTAHGSTLSRVVHAWVLARTDRARSWRFFLDALRGDVAGGDGSTTHEGIHLGAMAGSVDLLQRGYAGARPRDGVLWLAPALPPELHRLAFDLRYRGHTIGLEITPARLVVTTHQQVGTARIGVRDEVFELAADDRLEVALD